jgi:hypothetical protein
MPRLIWYFFSPFVFTRSRVFGRGCSTSWWQWRLSSREQFQREFDPPLIAQSLRLLSFHLQSLYAPYFYVTCAQSFLLSHLQAFDAGSAVGGAASPKSGILPPQLRGSGRAVGSALAAVRNAADSKDGGDAPPSAAASDVAGATAAIGMMSMEERDASALADYGGKESEPEGSGED